MIERDEIDRESTSLWPVHTDVWEGFVFVNLSREEPRPLLEHLADQQDEPLGMARFGLADLRIAQVTVNEVRANWKIVIENYNECLHCPGVHPELNALSSYDSGEPAFGKGAWCGGSMTLNEGAETMARNGGHAGRPPIAGLGPEDLASVWYFALFPNALVSLHPDYVMLHTLWPRSAGHTTVICEWLFEPETIAAEGFDPSDAIDFWDQVNREDWHVCELTQKGTRSRGYTAGRYTTHEADVQEFDRMVAERYMAALRAPEEVAP
jgi:Rieske 2Fe-2S family protein